MKSSSAALMLICLITGVSSSCSISDADRCPSGYVYISEAKVCALAVDAAPSTLPTTTGDSGASSIGETVEVSFGATCAVSTDCSSTTADYCLVLSGKPTGYCTKSRCTTDCPSGYSCCNCSVFAAPTCLAEADTAGVVAMGCSCL